MRLEDFVVLFKGNLESVFLTFPFDKDKRKLIPFYDCSVYNVSKFNIISMEIINGTVILSLYYEKF